MMNVLRMDLSIAGISPFREHAINDMNYPMSMRGNVHIMCDHQDGASFIIDCLEQFHDLFACFLIQRAGGFIGQEDAGIADQRSCYGNALLLTAGHCGWQSGAGEAGSSEK